MRIHGTPREQDSQSLTRRPDCQNDLALPLLAQPRISGRIAQCPCDDPQALNQFLRNQPSSLIATWCEPARMSFNPNCSATSSWPSLIC